MSYYDLSDPRADMQVFNHHNHNAVDIVSANEPISDERLAIIFHLGGSFATRVLDTRGLFKLMRLRQLFITCAMMAMIGAFLSGTFAVLHSDRNLAISACVVPVAMSAYLVLCNNIESLTLFGWKMEQKIDNFSDKR
ncbi:hypothetical protein Q3G72_006430 [Acer saccharum]|nr:hypothetical protein Q3G72_006430 [Acer saccharum]